ncbi:MAG: TetR/AcrR family transcriptional regulator [Mogibacterium sp.]|nr:TetR/AcrR family transcriptional regulator [Mogibacterium sp.]
MNKNDSRYISAEKKIMDAAFDLLLKRDIDSIWTQEIIRSAGVHKSTFYSHYRDKYVLLQLNSIIRYHSFCSSSFFLSSWRMNSFQSSSLAIAIVFAIQTPP